MLKLESVASFVSIAETGSIAGAARRLGISKSVVSERLTELKHVLGAKFIHRTTRRLSLTQDGNALYERARQILRDVDSAAAEVLETALRNRTLRVIDVGAEPEGATIFVAYPEDLRTSERIRVLTAWLQHAFGDPP